MPTQIGQLSYRQKKAYELVIHLESEGMAGATFNKHVLEDVLRVLQRRYLPQVQESIAGNLNDQVILNLDLLLSFIDSTIGDALLPWEDLEELLNSHQNSSEESFRDRLEMR